MAELRRSSVQNTRSEPVSIGEYRFDGDAGQLWRGADEIKLTPRASRLLAALAERPMQVVTKKQLVDRLWNGKAVGDDALTSCVQELRRALGDDPRSPRFVETRHRRGYRLMLPVTPAAIATGSALLPPLDKPSIAVLPFRNVSGNPEQEYFADGLAEDLITGLSRVSWIFVIARDSSFVFRGEKVDARTIGDRLGVRYLVEGSVRRAGPRLRLTVQLIEAATGNHLWADKYDGTLEDVFDFQDRTVVSLVGAMEPKLRAAEILRSRRKQPENLDAFDLCLQAQPRLASFSPQGIAEAIELFGRAIALAPDYAQALAHAAICRVVRPTLGYSPDADRDFREAAELSRRALDSDPTDTIALQVAAFVAAMVDRDYETAWDLVDKSLAINPNDTRTWNRRGWINAWAGEIEPAITAFKTVMRLSPIDPVWGFSPKYGMASALCWGGRQEEALPWIRQVHQERPDHAGIHRELIAVLWLSGRHVEAREAARDHIEMVPGFSLRQIRKVAPLRWTSGHEQYFDALRKVGLPE
jgi:TolB-like protein